MPTRIFVNMHVHDLAKSKAFFEKLGYRFNPQFTDDHAACLVISDSIHAMLLTTAAMDRFMPKGKVIADANKATEVMLALSCNSKATVDAIFGKAMAAGATECRPAEDHGAMYGRSINDPDGHIWEFFWMDPAMLQAQ